jgi:hypothetical protein
MLQYLALAALCIALTFWFKGLYYVSALVTPLMVTAFPLYHGYKELDRGHAIGWLYIAIGVGFSYLAYRLFTSRREDDDK